MSVPSNLVCRACGEPLSPPLDPSSSLRCPKCGQETPPSSADAASPAGAASRPASPQAAADEPLPSHLRPGGAGSVPTAPGSGGFRLQLDEQHAKGYRPRKKGSGWLGLLIGATAIMLLGTAAVAALALRLWKPEWFAPRPAVDRVSVRRITGNYARPLSWTDAATQSVRVSGLRIKVERVEIGSIIPKGDGGSVEEIAQDVVQVYLSLENEFDAPIDYVSWYGNEFEVGERTVRAKLSADELDLPMIVYDDVAGIYGHLPEATIGPKETIQDSIVFELPKSGAGSAPPWNLELPQAAFGFSGSIGFRIDERLVEKGSRLVNPGSALDNPTDDDR